MLRVHGREHFVLWFQSFEGVWWVVYGPASLEDCTKEYNRLTKNGTINTEENPGPWFDCYKIAGNIEADELCRGDLANYGHLLHKH